MRGLERRHQIVSAAAGVFASTGYQATSLRDIAAAAGISHTGLLRHYSSKAEILRAVFDMVSPTYAAPPPDQAASAITSLLDYAAKLPANPGMVTLIAAAYGSAANAADPMHEYMRGRMTHRAEVGLRHQSTRRDLGVGRDPDAEAHLFGSVWDGLQLMMLYAPELSDFATQVRRFYDDMSEPRTIPSTGVLAPPAIAVDAGDANETAPRRRSILAGALRLFASVGYTDTTMRDIAQAAGVAKSTLFHHFASKEGILRAALEVCDAAAITDLADVATHSARDALLLFAGRAGESPLARDGNRAHTLLCHEAAAHGHPEHSYIARRIRAFRALALTLFTTAHEQGSLPHERDPGHEATIFVAMWTGVHLQGLYEPTQFDPAAALQDYLRGLLRP